MMVTPLYAGLLVLWFLFLSVRIIRRRGSEKILLGDGGNAGMLRLVRGHANFAEYVPLALLMMAMLELSRFSIYVLHALGILLVISRLLHASAFSYAKHSMSPRIAGAGLTFLVLALEAVLCLYQAVIGHQLWMM
ncbi:MAG: glutathione metabolism protein [Betaproteobacteria bacterium]|nr:glutathione metabolism protein [Betaproteobacteria bacterium]